MNADLGQIEHVFSDKTGMPRQRDAFPPRRRRGVVRGEPLAGAAARTAPTAPAPPARPMRELRALVVGDTGGDDAVLAAAAAARRRARPRRRAEVDAAPPRPDAATLARPRASSRP